MSPLDWILNKEPAFWGTFPNVEAVLWNGLPILDTALREVPKLKDGETLVDWESFLNGILPNLKELLEYPFGRF